MIDVTAAIIAREGLILVARRKKGDHLEGKWEFPGGKIEAGETPEECLTRELAEEFGISAKIGEFVCESIHDYQLRTIRLLAYDVLEVAGDFKLESHDEIRWATGTELKEMDLAEADKLILQELLRRPMYGI